MKTLIAAIQFGSSHICAAAAWIQEDGTYEVLALERASTDGCIRRGCVVSGEEVVVRIKNLMQKLNNRVKAYGAGTLNSAYIGISGMSMHSMEYHPSILVGENDQINDDILDQLEQQSRSLKVGDYDIIGVEQCGVEIMEQRATGRHQLILAEHRVLQGYLTAMERSMIRVAGILPTPLIVGDILSAEERKNGVLLLDLGAHLTSVSIYANGVLQFLTVLPLGCDCITHDIATKGLRLEEAEALKVNWSNASYTNSEMQQATSAMPEQLTLKELNFIVMSRYEEIAANIARQIDLAGFRGMLNGGCVLTGGGSFQKGLISLLGKRLEISRISTRACSNVHYSGSERKPSFTAMMSMLTHCTESCEAPKETPAVPVTPPAPKPVETPAPHTAKKKPSGLGGFFGDLFSGMDVD